MPDPAKLLPQIHRAAMIQNTHPGRTGRILDIPSGDSLLIAGDLHGQLDILRRILLKADLGNQKNRHLLLQEVVHGFSTYDDGSDKSHQALDLVAALICQYPGRVHFLPGNHELAQIHGRMIMKNDRLLNEIFERGVAKAYGAGHTEILAAYATLVDSSPLAIRTPNRILVTHTLIKGASINAFDPEILKGAPIRTDFAPGGALYGLFWDRDTHPETVDAFLSKFDADWLVTGHIPLETGYELRSPKHVIVDCHHMPAGVVLAPMDRDLGPEGIGAHALRLA